MTTLEHKRAIEELQKRNQELSLLNEAARRLSRTLDLSVLYDTLHDLISKVMDCDCLYVSSFNPEEDRIHCTHAWYEGKRIDVSHFPPVPLEPEGAGTQSLVIRSGKPLRIPDYEAQIRTARKRYYLDDTTARNGDIPENANRTRSAAIVPIKLEERVIGVAQVQSYRMDAYTEDHLRILEALMLQVAVASTNAFLYEQAKKEIAERRRAEEAKERLEEQLRQAQKMEAIGQLAGGVAHDFNNTLMAISGYCELLLLKLSFTDPSAKMIKEILRAAQQGASITRQLLAFSRKQVLEPKVLDLNKVLSHMDDMLRRLIGEHIEMLMVFGSHLGSIKVDPGQIEQVVMNLAVNARDAMPKGGNLTIETAMVELASDQMQNHPDLTPGRYVVLSVSDTGCGMDEDVVARIFDPFFTTKEIGKGTGLGLATVYGIIKQSGGDISVYSQPGKGTTFKIYFPQEEKEPETTAVVPMTSQPASGHETILLVDDNEPLRLASEAVLHAHGYRILQAANGHEAIEISRRTSGPIHLLITDMVMPKMSGTELAQCIQTERPDIRVLFMSGYTEEAVIRHGMLQPGKAFVSKPVSMNTFLRKIRELLESS